jgi:transcriptional regulator with XRE-family HTH domain
MNVIEIHRRAKGWTQEELADRVGTSNRVVSMWECGGCPSRKFLQKLADVLGLTTLQIVESIASQNAETTSAA